MPDYFVDTTFFIDCQRGDPDARSFLQAAHTSGDTLTYSTVTAAELWIGAKTRQHEITLAALLESAQCVPLSCEAGEQGGRWLRDRDPQEQRRLLRDALIAASAKEQSLTLVTKNVRDISLFYDQVQSY